eukprot:Opistho-2@62676
MMLSCPRRERSSFTWWRTSSLSVGPRCRLSSTFTAARSPEAFVAQRTTEPFDTKSPIVQGPTVLPMGDAILHRLCSPPRCRAIDARCACYAAGYLRCAVADEQTQTATLSEMSRKAPHQPQWAGCPFQQIENIVDNASFYTGSDPCLRHTPVTPVTQTKTTLLSISAHKLLLKRKQMLMRQEPNTKGIPI